MLNQQKIKLMKWKDLLRKNLRNNKLTYKVIQTVLLEIEIVINNRRLTHSYLDTTKTALTQFMPMVTFCTPWKHQKARGFPMFSWDIKIIPLGWNALRHMFNHSSFNNRPSIVSIIKLLLKMKFKSQPV